MSSLSWSSNVHYIVQKTPRVKTLYFHLYVSQNSMQLDCRWLSLYVFSLHAFSRICDCNSVPWEAQYPIRSHGNSCRSDSFADWPHQFDRRYYKLRPHMVYPSQKTTVVFYVSILHAFDIRWDSRKSNPPPYQDSNLYLLSSYYDDMYTHSLRKRLDGAAWIWTLSFNGTVHYVTLPPNTCLCYIEIFRATEHLWSYEKLKLQQKLIKALKICLVSKTWTLK